MNKKLLLLLSLVVVVVASAYLTIQLTRKANPPTPIELVDYNWNIAVLDWEHEYVQAQVTLLNPSEVDAQFTLEIDLYDGDQYFESELWELELQAKQQKTFTKRVFYELLVNHHRPDAIEIICGIYGDDGCVDVLFFREFSEKA